MSYFNPALIINSYTQGCQIWSAVSASSILIEYSNTCLTDNFEHIIISTDRFFWNCPHHFEDFEIQYSFTSAPISTNLISFSLGAAPTLDSWNWLELNTASVEIILPINQYMMMRMTRMMMMRRRRKRREGDISQREVCAKPAERLNKQHLTTRITRSLDDDKEELSSLMIMIRLQTISYDQDLWISWWSWPW